MRFSSPILFPLFLCIALLFVAKARGRETQSSLQDVPRSEIASISKHIDSLVELQLKQHQQKPNSLSTDEAFIRRIYLDVVGRIPTLEEANTFLRSKDKAKRSKLIDQLLDSKGYVSHQFNFWADVLRIKSRLQGGIPGRPYIDFLKDALATNQPYDEFVNDMLASDGPALARGNGETGYYLRDQGMPEDNMANTARIFLGTRLECAQCHDHPFDKWTQREFFELVAFTGGLETRMRPGGDMMSSQNDFRRKLKASDASPQVQQLAQNLMRPLTYGVKGGGTGLARLPDSYQYDDGKPNEIVTAKTMFEHKELVQPTIPVSRSQKKKRKQRRPNKGKIQNAKDIGSREVFADWLTSSENPRFTMVVANRLWKKSMGLGLVEPVDDITDDTVASNQPLLDYLTEQMVGLNYDMKQFYRVIYNSKTYQREASDLDVADTTTYHFPGPLLRRLSAEQLWDSFLTLAVPDLDERENPRNKIGRMGLGSDIYDSYEKAKEMTVEQVIAMAEEELELRSDPKKRRERYQMAMKSMEPTKYDTEAESIKRQIAQLKKLQKQSRKNKRPQATRTLQAKIKLLSNQLRHVPAKISGDLVRASELPSPAPAGHFLREFGQSDREQIENANFEPAVNQVLSLMNGQIEKRIVNNPRTVLMRNVVNANSLANKINVVYLSMLSRRPTREEMVMWKNVADQEGAAAATDLIWTLANTSEFMFIR